MKTETCVLSDGRRVRFRLDTRKTSKFYYVYFEGPDGKRREISTKEPNQKRARDSALTIIGQEFEPKVHFRNVGWDEAIEKMVEQMQGRNLRQSTIETYEYAIKTLRTVFPKVEGPGTITTEMANQYKLVRLRKCKPETVKGDINELSIVFGKWWTKACDILDTNPFDAVEPPKVDKKEPRVIEEVESEALMTWLDARWDHWRMPLLFLEVKSRVGCRISELAKMPTDRLQDGRLMFEAVVAKGRKTRRSRLPSALYDELRSVAGPNFVFEKFPEQLKAVLLQRKRPHHAKCVKFPYDPNCLVGWLQDRMVEFRKAHPEIPYFKLHNYRGIAMSKAMEAGANYNDASIAFGCHPETMRKNYLKFDETRVSDSVMDRIQNEGYNRNRLPEVPPDKSVEE